MSIIETWRRDRHTARGWLGLGLANLLITLLLAALAHVSGAFVLALFLVAAAGVMAIGCGVQAARPPR